MKDEDAEAGGRWSAHLDKPHGENPNMRFRPERRAWAVDVSCGREDTDDAEAIRFPPCGVFVPVGRLPT